VRTVNVSGAIPLFRLYVFVAWQRAGYLFTTHLLTCSIQQNPSWKANRFSASQEITRILWNPKVHCRIHKSMPRVPILNKLPFIFSGEMCDKHLQSFCLRVDLSVWEILRYQSACCLFILGAFARLRKVTLSFVMSVCLSVCLSSWNNSAASWRIFTKFDTWIFFFSKICREISNFIKLWRQ